MVREISRPVLAESFEIRGSTPYVNGQPFPFYLSADYDITTEMLGGDISIVHLPLMVAPPAQGAPRVRGFRTGETPIFDRLENARSGGE